MSTDSLFQETIQPSSENRDERARRAVKVFRAMQPGLSGYARALTGRREVKIQIDQGIPRTDGKTIFYKPPIALGDLTPHSRRVCDKRDPDTKLQLCSACRVREEVLICIIHEIAHIAFDTFEKPSEKAIKESVERAIAEAPGKYGKSIREKWEKIPQYKKDSYLNLSSLISPYLPMIVNGLEDTRVDEKMFQARKGTRVMFDAYVQSIFRAGIEQEDGTFSTWADKPLNSQILIGTFVLTAGYTYEGWFDPKVEEALGDKQLRDLCRRIDTIRSAHGTYDLAFPILARLRELGFCRTEEEPEEEVQEPETEKDDSPDEQESDSEESGDSEESESSEEDSESGDSEESESSEEDSEENDGDEEGSGNRSDQPEDSDHSDDLGDSGRGEQVSEDEKNESDDQGSGDSESEADYLENSDVSDEILEEDGESDEGDAEPVDSGADDGDGGTEVEDYDYGSPEEAINDIQVFGQHAITIEMPETSPDEEKADDKALDLAIVQGEYFETPSVVVTGVREHKFGHPVMDGKHDMSSAWRSTHKGSVRTKMGTDANLEIPESIMGPALTQMRKTFADNKRADYQRNLKSGRVASRTLGKRAWNHDPRLFQKKRIPGKRSYAVIIGIDISGSTVGINIALAKRAAMAQAELCYRMGIDFAVFAHTARGQYSMEGGTVGYRDMYLDIYEIKAFDAPWDNTAHEALEAIGSDSENLDGHAVEYYRKMIEKHPATDKIIMYYSDGKMPAANHDEELEILIREIQYCKSHKILLQGVGIRTDSPARHGLDTVQVDADSDIVKVVRHLETALLRHR